MGEEETEPKISTPEVIIVGISLAILDGIELLLLFFLLDDFWIIDIFASLVALYLWFKGVSATRYLVMWVLELIPYVGNLPLLTLGFLMTVYLDRHPKLGAVVAKAAAVRGGVKGGVPAGKSAGAVSKGAGPGAVGGEGPTTTTRKGGLPEKGVPEEALGAQKEPMEKVADIMRKVPETEPTQGEGPEFKSYPDHFREKPVQEPSNPKEML